MHVDFSYLQARHPLEMHQPGVSHPGVREPQKFQARQPLQMNQPGVGHLSVIEIESLQARQTLEMHHVGVCGRTESDANDWIAGIPLAERDFATQGLD